MLQAKIFSFTNTNSLEEAINDFLATLQPCQVRDVKYGGCEEYSEALILYEKEAAQ